MRLPPDWDIEAVLKELLDRMKDGLKDLKDTSTIESVLESSKNWLEWMLKE